MADLGQFPAQLYEALWLTDTAEIRSYQTTSNGKTTDYCDGKSHDECRSASENDLNAAFDVMNSGGDLHCDKSLAIKPAK